MKLHLRKFFFANYTINTIFYQNFYYHNIIKIFIINIYIFFNKNKISNKHQNGSKNPFIKKVM
jgi:hypothetical protein